MTNEQSVIKAEERSEELKKAYISFLTPIVLRLQKTKDSPHLDELLHCQQLGNAYFNFLENFVGNSRLLGAHTNGKWVTGLAETCHSVLSAYITHIKFLRSYKSVFNGVNIEPDKFAFANMQRMVKEYLSKEASSSLEQDFQINKLPTNGFNIPAHADEKRIASWQTSIIIGLFCIVGVVLLSIFIPAPTEWQEFVFRGCLALGITALGIIIPGFLNIDARINGWGNYVKIVAGGSLAIFVFIWLVNPPSIKTSDNNITIPIEQAYENKKSLVVIRIQPIQEYPIEKVYDREIGQYFYKKRFKVILSNNGTANTSIVNWGVYLKSDLDEKQKEKSLYIWIAHFKPKLLQLNEKAFMFPQNINSGESLAFFMDINLENIKDKSNETNYVIRFEKADGTNIEALFNPFITYAMQGEIIKK